MMLWSGKPLEMEKKEIKYDSKTISKKFQYEGKPLVLRPKQIDPVEAGIEICKKHRRLLNVSDMGLGKTAVSMAVANNIGLPVVVIAVKSAFNIFYETFNKYEGVKLLGCIGNMEYHNGSHIDFLGFSIIRSRMNKKEEEIQATRGWKQLCEDGITLIIDEAHKFKNDTISNHTLAELTKWLFKSPKSCLIMNSATLVDSNSAAANMIKILGYYDISIPLYATRDKESVIEKDGRDLGIKLIMDRLREDFDKPNSSTLVDNIIVNTLNDKQHPMYIDKNSQHLIQRLHGQAGRAFKDSDGNIMVPNTANPNDEIIDLNTVYVRDSNGDIVRDINGQAILNPNENEAHIKNNYVAYPRLKNAAVADSLIRDLFLNVICNEYVGIVIEIEPNLLRYAYRAFLEIKDPRNIQNNAKAQIEYNIKEMRKTGIWDDYSGGKSNLAGFGKITVALGNIESYMVYEMFRIGLDIVKNEQHVLINPNIDYNAEGLDRPRYRIIFGALAIKNIEILISLLNAAGYAGKYLTFYGAQNSDTKELGSIDKWNAKNSEYLFFICTISSGALSISLHDTYGNRPSYLITSTDYRMNDSHQLTGRGTRVGMKSPCISYVVFPKLTFQLDKLLKSLKNKSNITLATRRHKTINVDGEVVNVSFPGSYPRFVEGYGYIDESGIVDRVNAGVYDKSIYSSLDNGIVSTIEAYKNDNYLDINGKVQSKAIPTIYPDFKIVDDTAESSDNSIEGAPERSPLVYPEGFVGQRPWRIGDLNYAASRNVLLYRDEINYNINYNIPNFAGFNNIGIPSNIMPGIPQNLSGVGTVNNYIGNTSNSTLYRNIEKLRLFREMQDDKKRLYSPFK